MFWFICPYPNNMGISCPRSNFINYFRNQWCRESELIKRHRENQNWMCQSVFQPAGKRQDDGEDSKECLERCNYPEKPDGSKSWNRESSSYSKNSNNSKRNPGLHIYRAIKCKVIQLFVGYFVIGNDFLFYIIWYSKYWQYNLIVCTILHSFCHFVQGWQKCSIIRENRMNSASWRNVLRTIYIPENLQNPVPSLYLCFVTYW